MSDFNYQDYLRNNPLTEQLESDEDFGTGDGETLDLASDVVFGRISYKEAREKASKASFSMKELNNAIAYIEDLTGRQAPNYSIDEDYDPDAEQDDEDVPNPVDDEGRPLGEGMHTKDPRQIEAENELRDEAKVFFLQKVRRGEIDTLPEDPLQAYMDMLTQDQMDHDAETLRYELGENIMKEESYSLKQFQRDLVTYIRTLAKEKGLKPDTAVRMAVVALQNADRLDEGKLKEILNVSRDALKRLYNEVGATTFSQMILELRDENALDDLVEALSYQYSGIMNEGLTIGGKKVKAIHTHDSNNVEDHTIEYEDGTEEPYLKHLQMKEARDYGMTYPSYNVKEFNTIGDMAQNGILNLLAFAEQHKPELAGKLKSLANDVTEVIYDDMEEFDTQPRIRVKETIKEQVDKMVGDAVKVFQKEGGALGVKALEDGLDIDTKKAKALLKTMIKKDLVFLHRDGDYILKEGHGLTADDIKVIEKTIDDSSDTKLTDILKFIVKSNINVTKRADLSKGK